jgi:hypothetical protein
VRSSTRVPSSGPPQLASPDMWVSPRPAYPGSASRCASRAASRSRGPRHRDLARLTRCEVETTRDRSIPRLKHAEPRSPFCAGIPVGEVPLCGEGNAFPSRRGKVFHSAPRFARQQAHDAPPDDGWVPALALPRARF